MTMKIIKIVSLLLASLILSHCARLSEDDCRNMDWRQNGYNDGSRGLYQRTLEKEIKDCSRFNIPVNTKAYKQGWRKGTRSFCTPDSGYQLGTDGRNFNNVCPSDLKKSFTRAWRRGLRQYCVPDTGYNLGRAGSVMPNFCAPDLVVAFRNAYQDGYRIYQAEREVRNEIASINEEIAQARSSVDQKQRAISDWQRQLNASDANGRPLVGQRRNARNNIRETQAEIRQLERRLDNLTDQRDRLQGRLSRIQTRS